MKFLTALSIIVGCDQLRNNEEIIELLKPLPEKTVSKSIEDLQTIKMKKVYLPKKRKLEVVNEKNKKLRENEKFTRKIINDFQTVKMSEIYSPKTDYDQMIITPFYEEKNYYFDDSEDMYYFDDNESENEFENGDYKMEMVKLIMKWNTKINEIKNEMEKIDKNREIKKYNQLNENMKIYNKSVGELIERYKNL